MIKEYNTKYGKVITLDNDVEFVRNLSQGKVFEEDLIIGKIIPYINNIENIVILDIGAHIGSHSIIYSNVLKNPVIYAFEPQKIIYQILSNNIKNNSIKNVKVFNNAVGHKNCLTTLSKKLYDGYDCDIEYFIDKPFNYGGIQLGIGGEKIEMITLDSLNLEKCDFIKMDVEGAESLVILGGINTIKKFRPIIFFESTDKKVNSEMIELFNIDFIVKSPDEILNELGYNIINVDNWNKIACYNL